MNRLILVLGGARSGKSVLAERLVLESGLAPVYCATAQVLDAEMAERVATHRARRAADWRFIEAPFDLAATIAAETNERRAVLVDCLTLWLTNVMLRGDDVAAASTALVDALGHAAGPVVCVSSELGLGIVPETRLGRRFRDAQGILNQAVAARADEVIFVAAGLPLHLKRAA